MAISLNNHETRISNLEKTATFLQKEIVYNNNTGTNSAISIPNLLSYDAVYVFVREECHHEGGSVMIVLPNDYNRRLPANHVNRHNNLITIISTTNKNISFVSDWSANGRFISVIGLKFGLKIYYIFRYNIYSKIILRIISKISHFFTKIFKYGGEIRDGYIC